MSVVTSTEAGMGVRGQGRDARAALSSVVHTSSPPLCSLLSHLVDTQMLTYSPPSQLVPRQHESQDCGTSREEIFRLDRRKYPGFFEHIPEPLGVQAGIR